MKKSSFIEGAFIATLAIFFTKFIGLVYVIPFYRIVGNIGGALYGYAYNIYNLFLIISSAGIPLAISKLTSEYNALGKNKEKAYMFKSTQMIVLIFSLISFLICFFGSNILAHIIAGNNNMSNSISDISYVIKCVSFAILVVPSLAISRGYLQGHGYIKPSSTSQIVEQLIRVAVIIGGSFSVLKIFHLSLKTAIGVAVFGACAGAIVSYLYLFSKLIKVRIKRIKTDDLSSHQKREIISKIIMYSIPFIITNIANSLYNTTDMILLLRGLSNIGFNGEDAETISAIFTTWGHKLNTIVTSIATGIAISLVPSIAESNVKGDLADVNNKMNKTIQIFFFIALPLAIFMSIFSREIWTIFYGYNTPYGPIIFRYLIITAAMDALYIMICNGLQGLNKTKLIYVSVFLGLLINLSLDLPLIYLFNKIGIYPYYGAITATIIGYSISLIIPLVVLKRKYHLNYNKTWKMLPKLLLVYLLMIFLCSSFEYIIEGLNRRLLNITLLLGYGLIILGIYLLINKKEIRYIFEEKIKRRKKDE